MNDELQEGLSFARFVLYQRLQGMEISADEYRLALLVEQFANLYYQAQGGLKNAMKWWVCEKCKDVVGPHATLDKIFEHAVTHGEKT